MADSVFTKIIKGEIPSYKIYEDAATYAFLDIHPKTAGHVLVVPKKQVEYVWDLSEEEYLQLMQAAKKVATRIKEVLSPGLVGMQVEGLGVPHAHVHIFPFNNAEEFHRVADPSAEPDHESLAEMQQKLAF